MKKELVLLVPEIDYALVHLPDNTCTPWVAAWGFDNDENGGHWGQGHYFMTKEAAQEYMVDVLKERWPIILKRKINKIMDA